MHGVLGCEFWGKFSVTGEYVSSFYLMSLFTILQAITILILHFMKTKIRQKD